VSLDAEDQGAVRHDLYDEAARAVIPLYQVSEYGPDYIIEHD
jgi:hypothetical protein